MKNLYTYFGWQGGTIHQIADITGCNSTDLIYGHYQVADGFIDHHQYVAGLAWSDNDLAIRLKLKEQWFGCLNFWLGVRDSVPVPLPVKMTFL